MQEIDLTKLSTVTLKALAERYRRQIQDPQDQTDKATIAGVLTEIKAILDARGEGGQDQPPPASS